MDIEHPEWFYPRYQDDPEAKCAVIIKGITYICDEDHANWAYEHGYQNATNAIDGWVNKVERYMHPATRAAYEMGYADGLGDHQSS